MATPIPTSDPPEAGKHRAEKKGFFEVWGPREVIALFVMVASFTLAGLVIFFGKGDITLPPWIAVVIGGVGVYYFGKRNGEKEKGEGERKEE